MAQKLNSFERFWKELKRRKVIHVITVYAAIAFVILQVVDMVAEPLRLPDSTKALVIVLLCIGFIIAVFLSWIYDITPAGVKKTRPVSTVKHGDQITSTVSIGWKIATYVSGIIIIALVAFNIVTRRNINKDLIESEKSIAVLPFKSLSDDPKNQYLADGMMDAILLHLSKIKDLKVLPRTSVEQYRGTTKVAHDIGKELDVEYLLEGSFQKFGDNARLIVQLIRARKESHVWANEYNSKWSEVFSVQSGVAQTIAKELYASITPVEKGLIEKVPTSNMTAYDLYLKANDFAKKYDKIRDLSSYHAAVNLYKAALEIDSAFAKAYTGLASAYYSRYYYPTYFKETFLDTCLVLTKKALSFDDQLDEAYYLKGLYYYANGQVAEALYNFDKAIQFNPNYYSVYYTKGNFTRYFINDYVKTLDNYHKALNLIRGNERVSLLRDLGDAYLFVGFIDKAKYYYQGALTMDGDSASYFKNLAFLEFCIENYENANLFNEKASRIDTIFIPNNDYYSFAGQHQKAYMASIKEVERLKKTSKLPLAYSHRIGYAFWQVGKRKEAEYYFEQQIKYGTEIIKLRRELASTKSAHYDLAATYAFLGEKTKAYQYLDDFNTLNFYPLWWISYAKHDPLFASIRNEERFQKILQNMEAKYQAEHERVKKWLVEQNML